MQPVRTVPFFNLYDDIQIGDYKGYLTCDQRASILYCVWFAREEWLAMLEDPNITRDILEFLARDDVGFPANVMVQRELSEAFPDHDLAILQYHVLCAIQSNLLMGFYETQDRHDGAEVRIGHIIGLTSKGGNYVRDSRTTYWNKAVAKIGELGLTVTTDRLLEVVADLTTKALQA